MHKKSLLFIGHVPPPFGGVSVHIARLAAAMRAHFSIDFIDESPVHKSAIYNFRSYKFLQYCRKIQKADIIHIHSSDWRLRLLHAFIVKISGKRMVITLHSLRKKSIMQIAATRWALRLADARVFVSAAIQQQLGLTDKNSFVQHAFLPPDLQTEPDLPKALLQKIIQAKHAGAKILLSNASRLDDFQQQDLYGVDLAIELIDKLQQSQPVLCVFIVNSLQRHADKFTAFQQQIQAHQLEQHMLLLYDNLSFARLAQYADVVLRLTNTDGDSLTVREALHMGVPVVASDVVTRPPGTILFKNRHADDLLAKVQSVLQHKIISSPQQENPVNFYLNLYEPENTTYAE